LTTLPADGHLAFEGQKPVGKREEGNDQGLVEGDDEESRGSHQVALPIVEAKPIEWSKTEIPVQVDAIVGKSED